MSAVVVFAIVLTTIFAAAALWCSWQLFALASVARGERRGARERLPGGACVLAALTLLNFIVLQWFGVRVGLRWERPLQLDPFAREPMPRRFVGWTSVRWIWPLTGWWSPLRWIERRGDP